jgi:hypothetical protein
MDRAPVCVVHIDRHAHDGAQRFEPIQQRPFASIHPAMPAGQLGIVEVLGVHCATTGTETVNVPVGAATPLPGVSRMTVPTAL